MLGNRDEYPFGQTDLPGSIVLWFHVPPDQTLLGSPMGQTNPFANKHTSSA